MRVGLQSRYGMLIATALLLSVAVMAELWQLNAETYRELSALSAGSVQRQAAHAMRDRGRVMARILADNVTNPLYYFDLQSVGEIVRSVQRDDDVAYVLIFDNEGKIVHDGSADIAAYGRPMRDPLAAQAIATQTALTQESPDIVDVTVPMFLGGDKLGGVRIGLSLKEAKVAADLSQANLEAEAEAAMARHRRVMMSLFIAIASIALLIGIWVSRALVRPIRALADSAKRIEGGDFGVQVESGRHDELGDLIRAFGRMSESVGKHHRDIHRLAYMDSLTGLPNRLMFRELLDRAIAEHQGTTARLALLFIDLDDFKRINDTLGHDAGDEVLTQFSSRLTRCCERLQSKTTGDVQKARFAARFGGDEFVILLIGEDAREMAEQLAQSLLEAVREPTSAGGRQVFLNTSIGITVFPDDAGNTMMLLKNGDIAMYQAKVQGKNCFRFFSERMTQAADDRLQLEHDLRQALSAGEIDVSYQPICALENGRLVGAEALVRWLHPTRGLVPPAEFVGIAEDYGLIGELGGFVLRRACAEAAAWHVADGEVPHVAVNLSGRQLRQENLVAEVSATLRETGLPAHRLHLELTENSLLDDEAQASAKLDELRALGVQVWLDDFGTGFSGLSHLRRIPVDGVKIDHSFVADMLTDPDDLALTGAIIAMAHSLGMRVIAEGVESEGQYDLLRDRGCDSAQGFWLGRPMRGEEFRKALLVLHEPSMAKRARAAI